MRIGRREGIGSVGELVFTTFAHVSYYIIPIVYHDGASPTHVLGLLQHPNEVDDASSIHRSLVLRPVPILVVFYHPALI